MSVELLNIDCMEYMKGLPDKAFDLAIVDPPYGLGEDSENMSRSFNKNGKAITINYQGRIIKAIKKMEALSFHCHNDVLAFLYSKERHKDLALRAANAFQVPICTRKPIVHHSLHKRKSLNS